MRIAEEAARQAADQIAQQQAEAFASEAFAEFSQAVSGYRKVQNVMLVTPVKGW